MEAPFASSGGTRRQSFLKPAVTERQWSSWNDAFDMMTPSAGSTGRVTLKELAFQHEMCPATCEYLCKAVGSGGQQELGFTKEEFLQKMLEVSGQRVRKEFLVLGRLCKM